MLKINKDAVNRYYNIIIRVRRIEFNNINYQTKNTIFQ